MWVAYILVAALSIAVAGAITESVLGPDEAPLAEASDRDRALVAGWYAATGQAVFEPLSEALHSVSTAAAAQDPGALYVACSNLLHTVEEAEGAPPVPTAETQKLWLEALDALALGARTCMTGTTTGDGAALEEASEALDAGRDRLAEAAAMF